MKADKERSATDEALAGGARCAQEDSTSGADPRQTEGPVSSLDELPEVARYLKRVDATPINFRAAVVREMAEGYPKESGRLTFASDGKVTVRGKAEGPTDAEQEAITAAFKRVEFPKQITLTAIAEPPPGVNLSDRNVWVCNGLNGEIVAVRQRIDKKDGGKDYWWWTRWSDGQWRTMEPEVLPFYGLLPGYREKSTLFLHEGEKAAARMQRLISGAESADHFPWFEQMRHGLHVGWTCGVNRVDHSDWEGLGKIGWRRVVVVADNDEGGMKAARRIAAKFSTNVEIIAFDERFNDRFDLGDPWPTELFDEHGRHIGPSMRDCLIPATQATFLSPPPPGQRGAPTKALREEYAALVAYTADPPRLFYRSHPSRDMRPETFNIRVAPFSHSANTAGLVWRHLGCQHERMVYRPGSSPGTLNIDGSRCFNVYEGAQIEPVKDDDSLWTGFLEHLFPDADERPAVMKWIATLIARPDIRMRYGMLLISATQGVGKNTLGNILRILLGPKNVSFPSEASVVDSAFNGWAARKRLIFISEFYSGEKRKAYDKLKPLITEEMIEINEKGVNQFEIDNWATIIACLNSEEALHLVDEDRRWMVPVVAERTQPDHWWARLYAWIAADGPGIILNWAQEHVNANGCVRTGDHAPGSKRKTAIVQRLRSPTLSLAVELAEHLLAFDEEVILPMRAVREWIARQLGFLRGDGSPNIADKRLASPEKITKALKAVEGVTIWADTQRQKIDGAKQALLMNFTPAEGVEWSEIKDRVRTLEKVKLDDM